MCINILICVIQKVCRKKKKYVYVAYYFELKNVVKYIID